MNVNPETLLCKALCLYSFRIYTGNVYTVNEILRTNAVFVFLYFQDNAVGTGTGKYKDRQLFRARQNHASLVPIMGLMKEAEFYQTVNPPQNHSEYSINSDKYGGRENHGFV